MFLPDRLKDNDDTVNILSVIWKKKQLYKMREFYVWTSNNFHPIIRFGKDLIFRPCKTMDL